MSLPVDFAFLHGGGQGSWVWKETIAALHLQSDGSFRRAVALDIPGCGTKRGRDTTELTPDQVADELLSELTEAGMSNILLVGHSQGGTMLPLLVERRPDLFRRLVYICCSAPLSGQSVIQMMGSGQHGSNADEVGWPRNPKEAGQREQYSLMFCNDMTEEAAAIFLGRLGEDKWPDLITYADDWRYDHLGAVPSTYVLCLRDGILPLAWQEEFAGRFRADDLVRIDAGHQVMNSRPHALAEVLLLEAKKRQ